MSFCNQCGTELPEGAKFCANCGAAVVGTAAVPPRTAPDLASEAAEAVDRPVHPTRPPHVAPGRPIISWSRGGVGWILPALVAVAVIMIGYLLMAPRMSSPTSAADEAGTVAESSGTRQGTPTDRRAVEEASDAATIAGAKTRVGNSVPAAVLDSAFNSDPAGAALRYAGPIRVSGTIATMVQPGPTPSLSMEGRTRFNYMIVEFPEGYRTRLVPLAKGQFVSVACDQVRSLGGTTILSGCLLA